MKDRPQSIMLSLRRHAVSKGVSEWRAWSDENTELDNPSNTTHANTPMVSQKSTPTSHVFHTNGSGLACIFFSRERIGFFVWVLRCTLFYASVDTHLCIVLH